MVKRYMTHDDQTPAEAEEASAPSNSLIVFASRTDESDIEQFIITHRKHAFVAVPTLLGLTGLRAIMRSIGSGEELPIGIIDYFGDLFPALLGMLFLVSIRWKYVEGFMICATCYLAHMLWSVASSHVAIDASGGISVRILIFLCEAFILHLANVFRDAYSGHTLLVRRQNS